MKNPNLPPGTAAPLLCIIALLLALSAIAQAQTETQQWIATTDAYWQAAFKRDVSDVHAMELGKLKVQYLNSLDAAITKATAAGDLDGALALRAEQKRFGDTNVFPELDDAADPAAMKQLRAAIHTQLAKLEKDKAARAKALHAKYDQVLTQTQTQLTQRGRLDDALLVKAKREQVAAAWMVPAIATSKAAAGTLVIWNQNNKGKGDRGTKKVKVVLLADGKETWRTNAINLAWDRSKETKTVVNVPAVRADTIRIELTDLLNDRGGLAEVEYVIDGKNIALGCSANASALWENNQEYAPNTLTDGNPKTFWLLPDRTKGWVELKLNEQK